MPRTTHIATMTFEDRIWLLHDKAEQARMLGRDTLADRLEDEAAQLLRSYEREQGCFAELAYGNADDSETRGWAV